MACYAIDKRQDEMNKECVCPTDDVEFMVMVIYIDN